MECSSVPLRPKVDSYCDGALRPIYHRTLMDGKTRRKKSTLTATMQRLGQIMIVAYTLFVFNGN